MIGLTSTSVYRLGDGGTGGGWPKDDEELWLKMKPDNFSILLQNANISLTMGTSPYLLNKGSSQRISAALLFASDLDELIINKIIAQDIYNNNYLISKEEPFSILFPASRDTVSGEINVLWNKGECTERNTFARIYLSINDEDYKLFLS